MATNFSKSSLKTINSDVINFADSIKRLESVTNYQHTKDGAYSWIVTHWDVRNGKKGTGEKNVTEGQTYHELANNLGFDKPRDFKKYVFGLLEGEGLHASMWAEVTDKKGQTSLKPAMFSSKSVEYADVKVIDAKGKETHPYVKLVGADGKKSVAKVDALKPLTKSVTAEQLFLLVIQNKACEEGVTAYTIDNFMADHTIAKDEAGDYVATAKEIVIEKPALATAKTEDVA